MRELDVIVVKSPQKDNHDGERQFSGYTFHWPSGEEVTTGIDKFCHFGVRFLVGKKRANLSRIALTLLAVNVDDINQRHPNGRFRRFLIRSDGVLCLMDSTPTQVQFSTKDEQKVLDWLNWKQEDTWVDIGVRYEEHIE
jgi:hypothetical protein